MNKKIIFAILILAILVASMLYYFQITNLETGPIHPDTNNNVQTNNSNPPTIQNDKISVDLPKAGDTVTSPLSISGKAKGTWYFEASFPIVLVDEFGNLLAQGQGHAQGDWMTENFVPFTAELSYDKTHLPASGRAVLILKKDNPSGDPSRDEAIQIPVYVK